MRRHSASQVAELLSGRAEDLARRLYPAGKKVGGEWCVGSVGGEEGGSLKIHLAGEKAGVWSDFATGEAGDALDLWAAATGCSLTDALKAAKEWLGIKDDPISSPRHYAKPDQTGIKKLKEGTKGWVYLTEERKLTPAVVQKYMVCAKDSGIVFPYLSPSGTLVQVKWLGLDRKNGRKEIISAKGAAPALFGWQAIDPKARSLLICEGEIDAMTWACYGFNALSVPVGAGLGHKNDWIEYEWERLEVYDDIYLSWDMDKPGQEAVQEVAQRLGLARTKIVNLPEPFKDMNEWHLHSACPCEVEKVLADALLLAPKEIATVSDWMARTREVLQPSGDKPVGFSSRLLEPHIIFRPCETTIWTGISSHGKSTLLSQLMLEAAAQGERVCMASLEVPIHRQLAKMARQFWAEEFPSQEQLDVFFAWISGRIFFLDLLGNIGHKHILDLFTYARARFGASQLVLDSLMKTDVSNDDFEAQRIALNAITSLAHDQNAHLHVVAHPRKGTDEHERPGKLDVKGSVDIINQPDNIVGIWRNRTKEQRIQQCQVNHTEVDPKMLREPDAILYVEKQRLTGWEGRCKLMFHPASTQFMREAGPLTKPMTFV